MRILAAAPKTDQVPEPIHRANQMYVEEFLFKHASSRPNITMRFGWRVEKFSQDEGGVSLEAATSGEGPTSDFFLDVTAFGLSIAFGLLSLVWFAGRLRRRRAEGGMSVHDIALGTAIGLGLHNFSEGLAIGQSAATGATAFALILVVGFALHNATEGFGIAAPLTTGPQPTWTFLLVLGLIGGGPTFLGGVIGYTFVSPLLSIVFLGLAAGALIYVFNEMMAVSRKFAEPVMANVALLVGLLVAFGTDFLLVAVGA